MRVFMLGWEFPPFISGGLGTACYGLTKALSAIGTDVIFVLPRPAASPTAIAPTATATPASAPAAAEQTPAPTEIPQPRRHVGYHLEEFEHVSFHAVGSQACDPYQSAPDYFLQQLRRETRTVATSIFDDPPRYDAPTPPSPAPAAPAPVHQYASDLFSEIQRYATLAGEIAREEEFDVVHAHDWMTFPAGMAAAAAKGVPLVVHIHSTEFDRSGENIDHRIFDIERRGMQAAMKVIAVSYLTRNQITHHYGVSPAKIDVVYNAIEPTANGFDPDRYRISNSEKIVLYLGRITHQKGPEYFLAAAKKVLEAYENVKFVMAGGGDLTRRAIEMASQMGIGHKVLFTGFLRGADVERIFRLADLYVMPSVSEPFGIAPLEAMSHDVPVLISKQSGVSELLKHVLKVDFWDTDEMANKIIAVLKYPPLAKTLRQHGSFEVRQLSWMDSARACLKTYEQARSMMKGRTAASDGSELPLIADLER